MKAETEAPHHERCVDNMKRPLITSSQTAQNWQKQNIEAQTACLHWKTCREYKVKITGSEIKANKPDIVMKTKINKTCMWNMKTGSEPVVMGALGLVKKGLGEIHLEIWNSTHTKVGIISKVTSPL